MKFFPPQMRSKIFQIRAGAMLRTKFYITEHEVDARLMQLFGVTKNELIEVAQIAMARRSESTAAAPLSAPGLLSYVFGTQHLRMLLLRKGYRIDRNENVESAINDKGTRIIFQNVDEACSLSRPPRAISSKGPASNRIIDDGQGQLFGLKDLPEVLPPGAVDGLKSSTWYYCASFDGENVKVEISLPATVRGSNFHGFLERIFILSGDGWGGSDFGIDDAPVEVIPIVTRR